MKRFCHATGVDGVFIRYFGLTREDVLKAAALPDEGSPAPKRRRRRSSAAVRELISAAARDLFAKRGLLR